MRFKWVAVLLFLFVTEIYAQPKIDSVLLQLQTIKNTMYKKYTPLSVAQFSKSYSDSMLGKRLEHILIDEIIPHWYGTNWDFDGYTAVPKQGNIACGYFISTTLEHAGVSVNRYKLAQLGPEDEAKSIACGDTVMHLICDKDSFERYCNLNLKEGLYFLGLKFHVVYLLKTASTIYIIHSNYLSPSEVVIQPVNKCDVLLQGEYFLTNISHNKKLLNKWRNAQKIN